MTAFVPSLWLFHRELFLFLNQMSTRPMFLLFLPSVLILFGIYIFCLPFFFWVAPFGFSWMLDKFLLRAIPVEVNSVPSTSPALLSSPCIHLIFLYRKSKSGSSAVAVMNDFEVAWRAWPVASRLVVQLLHAHRFPCLELVVGDNRNVFLLFILSCVSPIYA